ncbi:hypothetical protein ABID14_001475 [Peptoniphilus olsenii]|uniref:SLH domain-containing protein n=1 Tax=Peptoniphilus olsenii TaxID=411570 RepID=A0ABV2JD45_9FIRM
MKFFKKFSLIFISSTLILTNSVFARNFNDTRDHWAANSIDVITDNRIMQGYEDNTFRPEDFISRAEFYAVVNNMAKLDKTYTVTFSDVKTSDWFYQDVAKGIKAGYLTPTTGPLYPDREINREEVAEILGYMYSLKGNVSATNEFKDRGNIKSSARGYVGALVEAGILRGYSNGNFYPKRSMRRSEVAVLLRSLVDKYGYPTQKSVNNSKIKFGSRDLYE